MSEEFPNEHQSNEHNEGSHYSKELEKLLSKQPELQNWRDEIISAQTEQGRENEQQYSSLSIPESISRFFASLPHNVTGWMIRALSPENALLRVNANKFREVEQRPYVVIDPFRIGNLGRQHDSIALKDVKNKDDMSQMIASVQNWLLTAQPIISGRVVLGTDGRLGRFQEIKRPQIGRKSQKNPKLVPSNRAYLTTHQDIYGLLNSQQYAANHLDHGRQTVEQITDDVAQLIAHCLEKKPISPEISDNKDTIQTLIYNIQSRVKIRGSFFYLEKFLIDYLLKLDGGHHDSTRVYWAAKTLQAGLKDRIGKSGGIKEQVILLELGKNVELYHWKHKILGAKTGKVDIFGVLEDITNDFPAFQERIKQYTPSQKTPVMNPFSTFYREWSSFSNHATKDPLEAQKKVARQYIFVTLQEIKTRYAYQQGPKPGEISSLKKRIEILNQLRIQFFAEKPEITIDFGAERDTINATLKKEITRYK